MTDYTQVHYNPGIFGFVKAHRHFEGPALVMSVWEEDDREWAAVFWVKRLHHDASPVGPNLFSLKNSRTMKAVERTYDIFLSHGPPNAAYMEPEPDFQRQRVYNWEDDNIFPGHDMMTWKRCVNFLRKVWQDVGVGPEPSITLNTKSKRPVSYGGRICFPEFDKSFFWRKPILLHEIAHELQFADKHGPAFVTQYIDLCIKYLGMRRDDLVASANRYGVLNFG